MGRVPGNGTGTYGGPADTTGPGSGGGGGNGGAVTPAGPAVGGSPSGAGAPRGGAVLPTAHGKTARNLLKMDWQFPVFQSKSGLPGAQAGDTLAQAAERALPAKDAFLYIAGKDRRPLLVLRECKTCNGTDLALLSAAEDNSRTLVMSRWFRCVKLPENVLEQTHAFHALFAGEHPAHLFLARWDGSDPVLLKGDQSRTELWDAMQAMLSRTYLGDAKAATAEIEKIIAQYDVMDGRLEQIRKQIEKVAEDTGPKSSKLKSLQKDLDKARQDLEQLMQREKSASDLSLKPEPETSASTVGE